ncbi:MAG: hypothetical protein OEY07_05835 [Gammaproteobacteria bacterium]|nr:hypothetical protein [Gammaproteobacteria bacterium]
MNFRHNIALILAFNTSAILAADDYIDLQTTYIKGNKEMPQILYVVPWQDLKKSKSEEQYLILHSLFDDVFDPVTTDKVITGHTVIK